MNFIETGLAGGFFVDPQRIEDERGFFARTFARPLFEARGLNANFVQCNISYNPRKGTLRGMHYQVPPHAESKLIRCTRGAVFDVMVDLRPGSPTLRKWAGVELTADNRRLAYIPEGVAHGFVTLCDDSEVFYEITAEYDAKSARGVRWEDPVLAIRWPVEPTIVSERDRAFPLLDSGTP